METRAASTRPRRRRAQPSKPTRPPPPPPQVARAILKRLSRVYGHIYHSHFRQVAALGLEPHLATCFRHFVLFVREFDLVDEAEMAPVRELMERIAR